jgi:hypothetical protein
MLGVGEKGFSSSQDFLRKIQTLYSVIILPPMAISTFYFIGQMQEMVGILTVDEIWKYSVLSLVVLLVFFAYKNLFSGLKKLRQQNDISLSLKHKLYFNVISSQLTLLSVAAWVVGIAYIYTMDPYFSYLFLFVVLFSSVEWPTKFKIIRHMRLKGEEKNTVLKLLPFENS